MKIDLPVALYSSVYESVAAEIVDVAPHLTRATFAVHSWNSGGWTVSNIETGCAIIGGTNRADAVKLARLKLKFVNDEEIFSLLAAENRRQKKLKFQYIGDHVNLQVKP
jgi:hypothetical protein